VPWSTPFEDPIILPDGRQLLTLKDAADFIMKLPKAEYTAPEWQAAMEALILVAETSGPTMLARIGVMRALNRHVERVFNPERKDLPNLKPPTLIVGIFLFFMTLGIGLIVAANKYGPDPFRDSEMVACILKARGKTSYVCPYPLRD
jgi:hypothetical protein